MKKIELLAPAGSLPNLKAAVYSGADAVYLGMSRFNAREYAMNFNSAYLKEAIKICKSNNVKVYLAANTLVKNSEISDFFKQMKYAYEQGIDSVIIQDPSFIEIIRKSFPGLRVHMSTQAGIMNSYHANLFNADRIILARELDKKNIEMLRAKCGKELEIFVHGALCACISGSCLFSSLLGGRSGNRGKCAQPCRKRYNNSFLFSARELCLIDKLPEIIRLGINSLKIEGRMRTPFYTATATAVYREAIDSYYNGKFQVTSEMRKLLESAFSREFTEGKLSNQEVFNTKRAEGFSNIKEQFYEVKSKAINFEKREAMLEIPEAKLKNSEKKQLIVRVYNEKEALIASKYADIICIDLFDENFNELRKKAAGKPVYAVTPRIMFDEDIVKIDEKIRHLKPDGIIAGNLGILNMNFDIPIILDYNLNCFNDIQIGYYEKLGAKPIISPELSIKELENFKNKNFAVLVHGKIRLMTLAHKIPEGKIIDEKGFNFYIKAIPRGVEVINEKELGLFNKTRNLIKAGINQLYIDTESDSHYEEILKIYSDLLAGERARAADIEKQYVLGWSRQGVL